MISSFRRGTWKGIFKLMLSIIHHFKKIVVVMKDAIDTCLWWKDAFTSELSLKCHVCNDTIIETSFPAHSYQPIREFCLGNFGMEKNQSKKEMHHGNNSLLPFTGGNMSSVNKVTFIWWYPRLILSQIPHENSLFLSNVN